LEKETIGSEKLAEFVSTKNWINRISTNGQFIEENPEISSFMNKFHSKLIITSDSNCDDIFKGKQSISTSSDRNNQVYEDLLNRLICLGPRTILSNLLILNPNIAIDVYSSQVPTPSSSLSTTTLTTINQEENIVDPVGVLLLSITLEENYEIFAKIWQRLYSPISTGFQVATSAGSLMQENVNGVCFAIEKINITRSSISFISDEELMDCNSTKTVFTSSLSISSGDTSNIETGQIIPKVRDALRFAMLASPVRIVEPIYACDLQCDQHQLGNLYSVLSKRRGEVVKEDIIDGTSLFLLSATLPVAESFGFASELLKKTSGNATAPQLRFSHWQINSTDPFWKPTTAEELEDHGGYVSIESNMTRVIIDKIRKRKGLQIEEKVVASAEKQRTLTKNK
jgi:ribosome assembly protein 1